MICNITIFQKKIGLGPTPRSIQGDRTQALNLKSHLIFFISIAPLPAKFQRKILTTALVIAKFRYLTFNPLGGVKVKGVGQICYYVAVCVISFYLICNMTIFRKSLILASAPPLSPCVVRSNLICNMTVFRKKWPWPHP